MAASVTVRDMSIRPAMPAGDFTETLLATCGASPVIVRFRLSADTATELYLLAAAPLDVREVCETIQPLDDSFLRGVGEGRASATLAILRALDVAVPADLRSFFAACAVLCGSRRQEQQVAAAVGLSATTIRSRLATYRAVGARVPRYPRINATTLATHVLWARERSRMTPGQAAMRAGFASTRACDTYLKYNLGATAAQLVRLGGYQRLLTEMREWFAAPLRTEDYLRSRAGPSRRRTDTANVVDHHEATTRRTLNHHVSRTQST